MFVRPLLGQDYVPAIEQRQELHRTLSLTPFGPQPSPAIEERPEQAAYRSAKAAGATDVQARTAAHRVVAKNGTGRVMFTLFGGLSLNPALVVGALVAIAVATLPTRRKSRRSRRRRRR